MVMLSTRLTGSSTSMISRVQAQRGVHGGLGARRADMCARDEREARVLGQGVPVGDDRAPCPRGRGRRTAAAYVVDAGLAVEAGQRRVPVVAGEHLVGALARLHDLDVLADPLAEQVEGHDVVADHRLAHRADRVAERAGAARRWRPGCGGGRCRSARRSRRSRRTRRPPRPPTDSKPMLNGRQPGLPLLREQADDQAGVEAAGQQHADRDVGHQPAPDGDAQRVLDRVLPVARGPVRVLRAPLVRRLPVAALACSCRRPRSRAPSPAAACGRRRRIVRGAGTTAWKVR